VSADLKAPPPRGDDVAVVHPLQELIERRPLEAKAEPGQLVAEPAGRGLAQEQQAHDEVA
jgi:hypothetical protein